MKRRIFGKDSRPRSQLMSISVLALYLSSSLLNASVWAEFVSVQSCYLQEHWDISNDKQNLKLIYSDPYIAFYADSEVNSNRTDLFIPLSFAWKFVNSVRNSSEIFGAHHRLYVILQYDRKNGNIYTNTSADHCHNIDIDCGKPGKEGFCTLKDILDSVYVTVDKMAESQGKASALNLILEWRILGIVVYDKLVQDGMVDAADNLKTYFQDEALNFPQGLIYLNRDWYLPIYKKFHGGKAVPSFLSVYDRYTNGSLTGRNSSNGAITTGEFVLLWSEAVGSDLRDLTYFAFGWFRDYRMQFQEARKKLSFSTFSETYPNSSWYIPPRRFHNKYQNFTFFDGHVALYLEQEITPNIKNLTAFISDAWRYAKKSYGPFGPDPVLQVIFLLGDNYHEGCRNSRTPGEHSVNTAYEPRIYISCDLNRRLVTIGNDKMHRIMLMKEVATLAINLLKETSTWPGFVSQNQMRNIFLYDMYVGVGRTEDAVWKKGQSMIDVQFSRNTHTFWFLNWFFPLYSKHGGMKMNIVLKFLNQLQLHWPRNGTEFVGQMNYGEWVHFWSAAAREDLTHMAIQTYGWSSDNANELTQARKQFSQLNDNYEYVVNPSPPEIWKEHWDDHKEELYLVYSDENVVFYFDSGLDRNITWPFEFISRAWKYANDKYGPLGQDPMLYIVLHHTPSPCKNSKTQSYLDRKYENKNVIDCGQDNYYWEWETLAAADLLLVHLGRMIVNARNAGNWPVYTASHWSMENIFVYDIYTNLELEEDATRWKQQMLGDTEEIPSPDTFWFRDWYYPIYKDFGGSEAINNFFSVLYSNWPHVDYGYVYGNDFKLEIMIHFWSAAVGQNLWRLATKAFGWSTGNHQKFLQARRKYPLNYTDMYLNTRIAFPAEKMYDFWNDHSEEVTLVYVDANVAIYYDFEMERSLNIHLQAFSEAWNYALEKYGPIVSDNILYVALHADANGNGCGIRKVTNHSNNFHDVHIFDCSMDDDSWRSIAPAELLHILIQEIGYFIVLNPEESWPIDRIYLQDTAIILTYDICLGIGMTKVASNILKLKWQDTSFSNWYFRIYEKHGDSKTLNSFLKILHSLGPWSKTFFMDKNGRFNYGQLVHVWSGAAGVNLKYLTEKLFWIQAYDEQLEDAVKKFPWIQYNESDSTLVKDDESTALLLYEKSFNHKEILINAYVDSSVVIYFDVSVDRSAKWSFSLLSRAWKQLLVSYETLESARNSKVNIFLHSIGPTGCHSLWQSNHEEDKDRQNIIDCGKKFDDTVGWANETPENTDILISELANITQQSANQFVGKEAYERTPFTEMLVFDLYLKLGRLEDAFRFLQTRTEITIGVGRFWKIDWYLPIYTQYGGTSVFSRFLSLLAKHWNQSKLSEKNTNQRKMNIGEFVHFWSAAAGRNLYENAEHTFGWTEHHKDLDQFNDARKMFSFNYSCYDCHTQVKPMETNHLTFGLSIGIGILLLAAILLPLFIYRKLKILREQMRELTEEEVKEFFQGNSDASNTNINDGNASIASKPFDIAFEIPREFLQIVSDNVLGSGEFGIVLGGIIKSHGVKFTTDTIVAVKTVKPNVGVTYFKSLLTELKVMAFLGSHANIASLLGACTINIRSREVFVAIEFCTKGDLLGLLKNNRSNFSDLMMIRQNSSNGNSVETSFSNNQAGSGSNEFSTLDLLDWSIQISNGMAFIASKNVIHGDLAARNVLITAGNIAKISDFGLSRQLANYSIYMKTSRTPVPWRWMAIESLLEMHFSIRSDVWAFGVTLFEIFSLGTTPYPGLTWDNKFMEKLVQGERVSPPEFGNEDIYCLMMDCMKKEPMERVSFPEIITNLEVMKLNLAQINGQTAGASSSSYIPLINANGPISDNLNLTNISYENMKFA